MGIYVGYPRILCVRDNQEIKRKIQKKRKTHRHHEDYLYPLRCLSGCCRQSLPANGKLQRWHARSHLWSKNTPALILGELRPNNRDTKVPCVTSAASAIGCAPTDFACQCTSSEALISSAGECVVSACGSETASRLLSAASAICTACF